MSSAFSATRWVLAGTVGFRILAMAGQFFILRLATKEVVGAYGGLVDIALMALPVMTLSFDQLLIREKLRRRRFAVALSMILAAVGAMLAGLAAASVLLPAPFAGSFAATAVEDGGTWHAVALLAGVFAAMATKLSVRSLLAADLDFRRISIGEFGNGIITYIGGAAVVMLSPTAWALMAAYLAGELFECLWLYRGHRFRPLAVLAPRRWGLLRRLFARYWRFAIANSADLALNNIGSLIPGPMIVVLISTQANGDFRAARMLSQLPVMLLVGAIWRVAYPTLSGVSEELLQSRCLRIIGTTSACLAPVVLWLGFFADATLPILAGKQYAGTAPLVMLMTGYLILTAIYSPISTLDMIRDRSEVGLYWNAVHTAARIAAISWFAPQGLYAVIAAMSAVSFALWIVWAAMLGWLLRCGWRRYTWAVVRFVPLWIALCVGMWACRLALPTSPIAAAAASILPCALYGIAVLKFFPSESEMIWRLAGRKAK